MASLVPRIAQVVMINTIIFHLRIIIINTSFIIIVVSRGKQHLYLENKKLIEVIKTNVNIVNTSIIMFVVTRVERQLTWRARSSTSS